MTDPIPNNANRLAYWLGRLFHPAVICIPTLVLVLSDSPFAEAVGWTMLVAAMVTMPGLITIALLRKRQKHVYQRQTRGPVYLVIWLSVIGCLVVIWKGQGPTALQICMAALIVWLPVQLAINTYFTKISTHVAVVAGCATGLLLLGKLDTLFLQLIALLIIGSTIWARVTTRNHTVTQVLLGLVVGIGSVLAVFPLLLR